MLKPFFPDNNHDNSLLEFIGAPILEDYKASLEIDFSKLNLDLDKVSIRQATIPDVQAMSELINDYASQRIMLARGPQYLYTSIRDYMVATVDLETPKGLVNTIIAVGGCHFLWEDLAEVRSLAVHPKLKRSGLGKKMVDALIKSVEILGAKHIFTFTLAPEFFARVGFHEIDRKTIPPVIWSECSKCPKFYKCDEIGMMMHL